MYKKNNASKAESYFYTHPSYAYVGSSVIIHEVGGTEDPQQPYLE
jgi:hypothetical protein